MWRYAIKGDGSLLGNDEYIWGFNEKTGEMVSIYRVINIKYYSSNNNSQFLINQYKQHIQSGYWKEIFPKLVW